MEIYFERGGLALHFIPLISKWFEPSTDQVKVPFKNCNSGKTREKWLLKIYKIHFLIFLIQYIY